MEKQLRYPRKMHIYHINDDIDQLINMMVLLNDQVMNHYDIRYYGYPVIEISNGEVIATYHHQSTEDVLKDSLAKVKKQLLNPQDRDPYVSTIETFNPEEQWIEITPLKPRDLIILMQYTIKCTRGFTTWMTLHQPKGTKNQQLVVYYHDQDLIDYVLLPTLRSMGIQIKTITLGDIKLKHQNKKH